MTVDAHNATSATKGTNAINAATSVVSNATSTNATSTNAASTNAATNASPTSGVLTSVASNAAATSASTASAVDPATPQEPLQLLFLVHYPPVAGASMRAFARLLHDGMAARGHRCRMLTAPVRLGRWGRPGSGLAKWLGYGDQFLLFPLRLRRILRRLPPRTLVVVVDQALGPWIPWLGDRPHLVHVHDLLALRSSLGEFPANRLGRSGRWYQRWIRQGFSRARMFLCVSAATRDDLERLLLPPRPQAPPRRLAVLPNPLLPEWQGADPGRPRQAFLLHIGGTWYKNRRAVLAIHERLLQRPEGAGLALVIVGPPEPACEAWLQARPALAQRVERRQNLAAEEIRELYETAAALLFPSIAEGFGWPVLEALACGCPVVTTDAAPMTEVAADAACYLPPAPQPEQTELWSAWVEAAAERVAGVIGRSEQDRRQLRQRGLERARRFELAPYLDRLEGHYRQALALWEGQAGG